MEGTTSMRGKGNEGKRTGVGTPVSPYGAWGIAVGRGGLPCRGRSLPEGGVGSETQKTWGTGKACEGSAQAWRCSTLPAPCEWPVGVPSSCEWGARSSWGGPTGGGGGRGARVRGA